MTSKARLQTEQRRESALDLVTEYSAAQGIYVRASHNRGIKVIEV